MKIVKDYINSFAICLKEHKSTFFWNLLKQLFFPLGL